MTTQRIAIIGGGAIGGVLAAKANARGHDVTLCVRTPFERLVVETPDGREEIPVTLATDPADVDPVNWVFLTTKVQDVPGTAGWLHRFDQPSTPIVVVQNGVEHAEVLAPMGLAAPVLPALTYVGAERVLPGQVICRTDISLIVPDGDLGQRFESLITTDRVKVTRSADFHTDQWRKLLANLAANPITALTLRRLDVFSDPDILDLTRRILVEATEVAQAEGAKVGESDVAAILAGFTRYPSDNGSSMLYDRLAGHPTEHEHINGPVVRAGQRHGIDTPWNGTMLTLMRASAPCP